MSKHGFTPTKLPSHMQITSSLLPRQSRMHMAGNSSCHIRAQPPTRMAAETAQRNQADGLDAVLDKQNFAQARQDLMQQTEASTLPPREEPANGNEQIASGPEQPSRDSVSEPGQSQQRGLNRSNTQKFNRDRNSGSTSQRRSNPNADPNRRTGVIEDFPYKVGDYILGRVIWEDQNVGWRVEFVSNPDIVGLMPPAYKPYTLKDTLEDFWLPEGANGLLRMFQIENLPNTMYYHGKGPVVSARGWDFHIIWKRAEQIRQVHLEKTDTLAVSFRSSNNSGLLGVWDGIPLFVPWKFVVPYAVSLPADVKQAALERRLSEKISYVRIVDVAAQKNRFVGNLVDADQIRALEAAQIGDLMEGKVQAIQSYGIFVRMGPYGGIKGLLHIRNISQAHTTDLQRYFKVGQPIKAFLFDVDEKNQVEYSTRELEEYSGEMLEDAEKVYKEAETRGAFWELHDKLREPRRQQEQSFARPTANTYKPDLSESTLDW